MQAIRDYITNEDSSLLSFRKNDIIKIVNTKNYTPQGWLRGVLNGKKGMFPVEYVRPIPRSELTDISKILNQCFPDDSCSLADDKSTHQLATIIEDLNGANHHNEKAQSNNYIKQDGHYSMMEFAMMNFKQSIDKLVEAFLNI